jgi:glycosyltransferase involved in cell wall biosynthesis
MGVECSVLIPAFNEEATLASTVAAARAALAQAGATFEFVLVDDGSTDGTFAEIARLCADGDARGLRFARNFGKEAAIRAGLEAARGACVVVMDADAQHPAALIGDMLARWRAGGVDVVEAVKRERGDERWARRAAAAAFYRTFAALTGQDLEGQSDFKLLDRRAVEHYLALPETHLFFRGMTAWLGLRRAALPFDVAPRAGGRSGWSLRALARLAVRAVTSFTSAPLHLVTLAGLAFLLFAVLLGAQTVWRWIGGSAVEGFTTVILLLLIIGSTVMIGLGVIGEYLARIYDEVKRRPRYIVAERIEATAPPQHGGGASTPPAHSRR